LQSYTQRHYARVDRLLRSTFIVDYVLGAMHVLTPEVGVDREEEAAAAEDGLVGAAVVERDGHALTNGHAHGDGIGENSLDEGEEERRGVLHHGDAGNGYDSDEEEEEVAIAAGQGLTRTRSGRKRTTQGTEKSSGTKKTAKRRRKKNVDV